jgi:hypothetical protein
VDGALMVVIAAPVESTFASRTTLGAKNSGIAVKTFNRKMGVISLQSLIKLPLVKVKCLQNVKFKNNDLT